MLSKKFLHVLKKNDRYKVPRVNEKLHYFSDRDRLSKRPINGDQVFIHQERFTFPTNQKSQKNKMKN